MPEVCWFTRDFEVELGFVSPKGSQSPSEPPEEGQPLPNSAVEDFFSKMNHDFRRPKPSEDAVAAALQAIQALAADVAMEESGSVQSSPALTESGPAVKVQCPKCSGLNSESNRFCGFCGTTLETSGKVPVRRAAVDQGAPPEQHIHHHHHHYHHFPTGNDEEKTSQETAAPPVGLDPAETATADAALRKLVQRWTMAYNSKRLDDIAGLYSTEAIVLRPSTLPIRGRSGVREHLATAMGSGLGDIQLDCTDIGVLGEIACLSGRNRMLMPVTAANRQERTGKFLMVARREGGEWRLLADVWCMDMPPTPAPSPRAPRKS
jgi:uncharacterized protein (TIGR02246 family)